MNHSFIASIAKKDICAVCKKDEIAHTDNAVCEACGKTGPVEVKYGNMLMCSSCIELEAKAWAESQSPNAQQARVNALNESIEKAKAIDNSIQVRTDIFNAATVAILDIKKSIDENETIANKQFALAEYLVERHNHFQTVIFEANQAVVDATNNQRAIQQYLNNLANQLRSEEREKLKLQDINYKPTAPKPVKPKAITTKKAKIDKAEVKKYALELGISEFTLQALCISGNITPEQAANKLRKSINEAKSEV